MPHIITRRGLTYHHTQHGKSHTDEISVREVEAIIKRAIELKREVAYTTTSYWLMRGAYDLLVDTSVIVNINCRIEAHEGEFEEYAPFEKEGVL